METPNERLRAVREKRYASASDAATAMGLKVPTYSQHENGIRGSGSIPRPAAERYARFFGVSLDWLLTGRGEQDDTEPTVADLEEMIRVIVDDEVNLQTRISDLPHIFGSALHEQLRRFRSDRASRQAASSTIVRGKGARSPVPTRPNASEE